MTHQPGDLNPVAAMIQHMVTITGIINSLQDIVRVARAILKIAQNQSLDEHAAFSAASLAIRECTTVLFLI